MRALLCRYPERFLFGSDLVTRHHLTHEHYVSRYWCLRTLWESDWQAAVPLPTRITSLLGEPATPMLRGLALPGNVLEQIYFSNATRLLSPRLAAIGSEHRIVGACS